MSGLYPDVNNIRQPSANLTCESISSPAQHSIAFPAILVRHLVEVRDQLFLRACRRHVAQLLLQPPEVLGWACLSEVWAELSDQFQSSRSILVSRTQCNAREPRKSRSALNSQQIVRVLPSLNARLQFTGPVLPNYDRRLEIRIDVM